VFSVFSVCLVCVFVTNVNEYKYGAKKKNYFVNFRHLLVVKDLLANSEHKLWQTLQYLRVIEHHNIFAPILCDRIYEVLLSYDLRTRRIWQNDKQ
jgi:hypothetical protein